MAGAENGSQDQLRQSGFYPTGKYTERISSSYEAGRDFLRKKYLGMPLYVLACIFIFSLVIFDNTTLITAKRTDHYNYDTGIMEAALQGSKLTNVMRFSATFALKGKAVKNGFTSQTLRKKHAKEIHKTVNRVVNTGDLSLVDIYPIPGLFVRVNRVKEWKTQIKKNLNHLLHPETKITEPVWRVQIKIHAPLRPKYYATALEDALVYKTLVYKYSRGRGRSPQHKGKLKHYCTLLKGDRVPIVIGSKKYWTIDANWKYSSCKSSGIKGGSYWQGDRGRVEKSKTRIDLEERNDKP